MADIRVLVVDSDPVTGRVVAAALGRRGHSVTSAASAEEALRTIERSAPDVLILDPALRGMDGFAMVRSLRTRPEFAVMPVIFLADKKAVEEHIRGFKIGADDFLPKPLHAGELELRIVIALKARDEAKNAVAPEKDASGTWSAPRKGLRGSLQTLGLPSLLSLLDRQRMTGVLILNVKEMKDKARIYLSDGRVWSARFDHVPEPRNEDLVYAVIGYTGGLFDIRPGTIVMRDEIGLSTTQILLEAARRLDEPKA